MLRRKPSGEVDADNPMLPNWPEADFIIGNPPFITGQDLREELGSDYAEALWQANPRGPKSADFVMQWWDRAAHILVAEGSPLIRFGFVTTNSITQTFSRRVIESYLADSRVTLRFAVPDHPWVKPPKAEPRVKGDSRKQDRKKVAGTAAVRIAMTVADRDPAEGSFVTTKREAALDTDKPEVEYYPPVVGRINADLSTGTDVTKAVRLLANTGMCHDGVKLHGKGFALLRKEAEALELGQVEGLE